MMALIESRPERFPYDARAGTTYGNRRRQRHFEGVYTTPHTQDLLALIGSLVNVGEGPSDRIEIILRFEPEPFDEFI